MDVRNGARLRVWATPCHALRPPAPLGRQAGGAWLRDELASFPHTAGLGGAGGTTQQRREGFCTTAWWNVPELSFSHCPAQVNYSCCLNHPRLSGAPCAPRLERDQPQRLGPSEPLASRGPGPKGRAGLA